MAHLRQYLLLSEEGEWWADPSMHGETLEEALVVLGFEPDDKLYLVEIVGAPRLHQVKAKLSLAKLVD